MRHAILSLLVFVIASCAHTAVAPVSTPGGEAVVIRIPGVPKGGEVKRSQVMAIEEQLMDGLTGDTLIWRYFPELEGKGEAAATVIGAVGETRTKKGESFHAYLPLVVVHATAPVERVEEAAAKMAVDLYKKVRKTADVYPMSQLAERPKS